MRGCDTRMLEDDALWLAWLGSAQQWGLRGVLKSFAEGQLRNR